MLKARFHSHEEMFCNEVCLLGKVNGSDLVNVIEAELVLVKELLIV